MKRKIAALSLALVTALTSSFTVFARYNDTSGEFDYSATAEAATNDITWGIYHQNNQENIVLSWPAVDLQGNIINQNPLKSTSKFGDPTGGWTIPTQGMIISYEGWNPEGNPNKLTPNQNTISANSKVLYGLTADEAHKSDIPLVLRDYPEGSTTAFMTGTAYLDTTVVAENFATAYDIEYSKDGVTWKLDHTVSGNGIMHGNAIARPSDAESGFTSDRGNTYFLLNEIDEALTTKLESDTDYFIRVTGYDISNKTVVSPKVFQTKIHTPKVIEKMPAFPTAQGGGMFSQGGRNGDVYVVTNLTDSVSDPQPGSLRYGLKRKGVSNASQPRIIVFAVGGTIEVDPNASKGERKLDVPSNTTILGQTAPGEGITLKGMTLTINGENIITRYIRTRLGAGYDRDAATASGKNIVVDHCSFEWGTDETFSAKEAIDSTFSYNIIASGLAMVNKNGDKNTDAEIVSAESEAKHGMGSLLNGSNTTVIYNLWAHNGTRNPRFEGGFSYGNVRYENKMDFANNVIYNWGHNPGYGGERGKGEVNFVNNYFKPGPNTLSKVKDYIFDCDSSSSYKSSYYVSGNVMEGNDAVTKDNIHGGVSNNTAGMRDVDNAATILSKPVELERPYEAESAEEAYKKVLAGVGASYARDAQDKRILNDVLTGTGRFINDPSEAGGYDTETFNIWNNKGAEYNIDADKDGILDYWEKEHGLDPTDKTDSAKIVEDAASPYNGYSWIEAYASDILGEWDGTPYASNSTDKIEIKSILDKKGNDVMNMAASKLEVGETYTIENIAPVSETAANYEVFLNDSKIESQYNAENNTLTFIPEKEGMYNLVVKKTISVPGNAYSDKTLSELIPVAVITGKDINLTGFKTDNIGNVPAEGFVSYQKSDKTMIMGGAGKVGITAANGAVEPDSFFYNYKKMSGDVTVVTKVNSLAKLDYYQKAGVMLRSSLDPSSEFYMAGVSYLKGEDYEGQTDASGGAVKAKNVRSFSRSKDGGSVSNGKFVGIPLKRLSEEPNYGWIKVEKKGQTVTTYGCTDGTSWTKLDEFTTTLPETFYVGFEVDAAQDTMTLARYNAAEFSDISITTGESDKPVYINPGLGDANLDNKVDASDVALIMKKIKGETEISEEGLENANIDGTGNLTIETARQLLMKVRRADYELPLEK